MILMPFLHGRDDLLRHHQVRAVADEDVDVALRRGHLHAEPAGNLVSHARVAVLHVIALGVARAPQLVQVARQAAGGADDDVGRRERLLQHADHLRLLSIADCGLRTADWLRIAGLRQHTRSTSARHAACNAAIVSVYVGADAIAGDERQQLLEHRARIADQRQRGVLEGVELGDVDRDEPHVLVLERGLRRGREVAQTRADDDARGRRRAARRFAACVPVAPTPPSGQRMRLRQRAFAGLRLADGDAGRVDELPQRVGRLAVDHAAAGDDHRPLAGANQPRRLLQPIAIRARRAAIVQTRGSKSAAG